MFLLKTSLEQSRSKGKPLKTLGRIHKTAKKNKNEETTTINKNAVAIWGQNERP